MRDRAVFEQIVADAYALLDINKPDTYHGNYEDIARRLIAGEWTAYRTWVRGGVRPPPPPPPFPQPQGQPQEQHQPQRQPGRLPALRRMGRQLGGRLWPNWRQQRQPQQPQQPQQEAEPLPDLDVAFEELQQEELTRQQAGRAQFEQMTGWRSTRQDSDEEGSSSSPGAASDHDDIQPPPLLERNIQIRAPTPQRHHKQRENIPETEPLTPHGQRQHPAGQPSPSPPRQWRYELQGARPKDIQASPTPPPIIRKIPGKQAIKKLYSKYRE